MSSMETTGYWLSELLGHFSELLTNADSLWQLADLVNGLDPNAIIAALPHIQEMLTTTDMAATIQAK